ncbi:MAG: hypothetical protein K2R98_14905 [Gemmataceae bacterium]|nr:hypothetical protein [Gemmataceae bacterium]
MRAMLRLAGFLLSVMLLAGCAIQKPLSVEKTLDVGPGESRVVLVDAPVRDQKVNVSVNSGGVPVDVYVILEESDDKALEIAGKATMSGQAPAGALASNQKSAEANVDATIPAKKAFAVLVCNNVNNKKADVKVKVTSK